MNKFLFAGLGNPGFKYRYTRHNLGFMLADMLGNKFKKSPSGSFIYSDRDELAAVKPLTFMNRSGIAVKEALDYFDLALEDLLVAYDDFNLPLGKIRLRPGGSSGGHKGIQSIIDSLGSRDFCRLRMGIGGVHSLNKTAYVLERFKPGEKKIVEDMLSDAAAAIRCYAGHGIEEAMNRFN
ncbi:MAG: aminoacyl-tRNA hydrolase [Elusimicrobiota bacterium]